MKLALDWVGEHVDLSGSSPQELAERLTAAGHAVEGIEDTPAGVVFDCDLTTNRPDVMCHRGLARELATVLDRPLLPVRFELEESSERTSGVVRLAIEASDGCAVYHARVIRGVEVGPSPPWLVDRLEAIGQRSINNVVDVTNFVLWDLGQPLHAFDLATLPGAEVRVRRSRAGERLVTLDGVERELAQGTLVIAGRSEVIALAGVMGGRDTEVTETTRDVLLEAAFFTPRDVRATGRATGLHTDAKHRYERGADPEATGEAIDRAAALIAQLAGGVVLAGRVEARGASPRTPPAISLVQSRLDRFVGIAIPRAETERILTSLGCALIPIGGGWMVVPPSWRRFDLEEEADIFEEVVRIYGFDRIPATLPAVAGADAPEGQAHRVRRTVRRVLVSAGMVEVINYAFHDAAADAAWPGLEVGGSAPRLANPLSERLAVMRRSLTPGLIAAARFNQRRGADNVRMFEIGHTFWRDGAGHCGEADSVALVVGGRLGSAWTRRLDLDLFDAKGALEAVAEALGVALTVRPGADIAGLDPEVRGMVLDASGAEVGFLGRLGDREGYDLFVAELRLDRLAVMADPPRVSPVPRFPAVEADLTLTHPLTTPWSDIEAAIAADPIVDLVAVALIDRYQGEGVPAGAVNTTISFRYQNSERSLTQDEVNDRHLTLAARLRERFGVESSS